MSCTTLETLGPEVDRVVDMPVAIPAWKTSGPCLPLVVFWRPLGQCRPTPRPLHPSGCRTMALCACSFFLTLLFFKRRLSDYTRKNVLFNPFESERLYASQSVGSTAHSRQCTFSCWQSLYTAN